MSGQTASAWLCALACSAVLGACGGGDAPRSGELATIGREPAPGGRDDVSRAAGPARSRGQGDAGRGARGDGGVAGRAGRTQRLPEGAKHEATLVRALVLQLVEGLNGRDPSTCTRLFSQRLVRGPKRAEVVSRCERRVAATSAKVKLAHIEVVKISRADEGTTGVVQFVTTTAEGRRQRHRFHLIRSGGSYKVDGVYRVTQPA